MTAPVPKHVELHLHANPSFIKFTKAVKALSGSYSACRGNNRIRFVVLPWTDEGRKLANRLFVKFGYGEKITCIMRGVDRYNEQNVPSWVVVQYIPKKTTDPMARLLELYERAFQQAVDRKILV